MQQIFTLLVRRGASVFYIPPVANTAPTMAASAPEAAPPTAEAVDGDAIGADELSADIIMHALRALGAEDAHAAAQSCTAWLDAWRSNIVRIEGVISNQVRTVPKVMPWRVTPPHPGTEAPPHPCTPAKAAQYHREACVPRPGIESGIRHVLPHEWSFVAPSGEQHARGPDRTPLCSLLGVAAICALPDGRICACVAYGVTVLSRDTHPCVVARITDAGQAARPGAGLIRPTAIATDGESLFVVDTSLGSIFRYSLTDFRLLRSGPREGLYWGDCEDGHHIAVGGGRIYYTAGTGDPGCSDRSHDPETSVVHVLDAETLEELRAFPTRMSNTVPDVTGCTDCPPGAIAIQGEELFLSDVSDSSALVQVFHTDGTHLRTIYPPAGAYYDYVGDEIPDDGRPDVWRRLGTPGSVCVVNGLLYLQLEEQVVDCSPDDPDEVPISLHEPGAEDRTAAAVVVMSLTGEWRQLYLFRDDSCRQVEQLKRLGVERRTSEWRLAAGPDGTLLLAESRDAGQPPDAGFGYCDHEGRIHVLCCEPRSVHWHQPCLRDSVELGASAKAILAEGLRRAVSTLAMILLKKKYQERRDGTSPCSDFMTCACG